MPAEETLDRSTADSANVDELAAQFIAKHAGDPVKAVGALLADNQKYRARVKESTTRPDPADVAELTIEDVNALATYRKLGTPQNVEWLVGKGALWQRARELEIVATQAGMPSGRAHLLAPISDGCEFSTRQTASGRTVVLVKKGDAEPVAFDTYFADFLPAFRGDETSRPKPTDTPNRGRRFQATGAGEATPRVQSRIANPKTPDLRRDGRYLGY